MADQDDTYQDRQENELSVLQAMFSDDFEDLNPGNHVRGAEFRLHLLPTQGMSFTGDVHVTVDLKVRYPPRYPDELPSLTLENAKGIANDKIKIFQKKLDSAAKKMLGEEPSHQVSARKSYLHFGHCFGEVMIMELSQHVQNFLHSHNVPGFKSFYEEMMSNKKREEEKVAKEHQKQLEFQRKKHEKERKDLEEEILRRQEVMKEESRRRKELAKQEEGGSSENSDKQTSAPSSPEKTYRKRHKSESSPNRRKHQPDPVDLSGNDTRARAKSIGTSKPSKTENDVNQKKQATRSKSDGSVLNQVVNTVFNTKGERTITRGKMISCNPGGSTTYVGMDAKTGELVTVREWVMKWKHGKGRKPLPDEEQAAEDCIKQLTSIEQELLSLLRLDHPNIVHYLAIKHSQGKEATTVELLVEYVGSGSLTEQLIENGPLPIDILRQYSADLLEVLSYLHGKAVVHKDLRTSSVYLAGNGRLKVADYSLCKRLNDLCETVNAERHSVRFSEEKSYGGRGGKKGDVLQLGILLMSLLEGTTDIEYPCEVPQDLPTELRDFLSRCLDTDERNRSTVQFLLDHSFIKPPINSSLNDSVSTVNNNESRQVNHSLEDESDYVAFIPQVSYDLSLGHSRLHQEFEFQEFLGKGGFGNVIKYQNKLDSNYYAIKKILLNPKSKELNKKITREVKLLSRLNHENVVRYYNSWIEVADTPPTTDESETSKTTTTTSTRTDNEDHRAKGGLESLSSDDIEKLAPRLSAYGSLEWSSSKDTGRSLESSSDDESSDGGVFGASFMHYISESSSDGIEFEHDSEDEASSNTKSKSSEKQSSEDSETIHQRIAQVQYLYIQMEFCDSGTLRLKIDQGLHKDQRRVWRYFREIVEGLVHIHSQGMIHRDLKPVNIFLDSSDMIKIGDFGLATAEQVGTSALSEISLQGSLHESSHSADGSAGGNMTGKVGTALYVSPELCKAKASHYNQKVDLYSLGIIFFEMCNPPPSTNMERVKLLSQVRQESIQLPDDFKVHHESQTKIICWLLNHDPTNRPTALELLQSPDLPPPQMEDARLQEMLRQTIANTKSKAYRYLMHECFTQSLPPVADFMYDMDIQKGYSMKNCVIHQVVYESLYKIFQLHGAVKLNTPLLLPKGDIQDTYESCCCLMDRSGQLITLPHDLRIPFARFIARNNVNNMKRFSIERVYREKKVYGSHPRELTEVAFDIVTTNTASLIPDAEVLHVVSEIINEFPSLQNRNYSIRLNHTLLLTGILNHCGIAEDKHHEVYTILSEAKMERLTKLQVQTRLCSLSLSVQDVANLYRYIELEGPYSHVQGELKQLTKGKGPTASIVKQGLHELEAIITQAQVFGIRQEMIINLGLVYNIQCFSGMIFQFLAQPVHRKKKSVMDVLAAGGRYDKLIPLFKRLSSTSSQNIHMQTAVGVSVSFERIVSAIQQDEGAMDIIPTVIDILVCAIGSSCSLKDRIRVVRDLWAAGLKADILCDTTLALEEIQELCKGFGIAHMVLLKDTEHVKIRSFDKDRGTIAESRVVFDKVVETLQQKLCKVEIADTSTSSSTKSGNVEYREVPDYNVQFIQQEKLDPGLKKRHDRQIQIRIQPLLECLSTKVTVEIVAVDLPMYVVKNMVAILDFDGGEEAYEASVSALCDKHRYKKYLVKICDVLQELKKNKSVPSVILVLYSYKEDAFKVIY